MTSKSVSGNSVALEEMKSETFLLRVVSLVLRGDLPASSCSSIDRTSIDF